MGWSDTHRYYEILRAAEAGLDRRLDGVARWHEEYAPVVRDPEMLRLALLRRWRLIVEAQLESLADPGELHALADRHPGLVLFVTRDRLPETRQVVAA